MRLVDADVAQSIADKELFVDEAGTVQFVLSHTPTIDPSTLRPKGEWIMRGGKLYCSHCGERAGVARDGDDFWYTKGTDFCPSCGADMRPKEAHNGC